MEPKTTTEIALAVVRKHYHQFEIENDARFMSHLVATIEDPTMAGAEIEDLASPAALWVRASLRYTDIAASESATCDLFYLLGRQDELGWIEEQVPGYQFSPEDYS